MWVASLILRSDGLIVAKEVAGHKDSIKGAL